MPTTTDRWILPRYYEKPFLPNRRAAMLTLLLTYGQLCGRAKEEAERQGSVRLNKPQEVEAPTSSKGFLE